MEANSYFSADYRHRNHLSSGCGWPSVSPPDGVVNAPSMTVAQLNSGEVFRQRGHSF